MMMVFPPLLKLAINGLLAVTSSSAMPLLSENVACVMILLSKEIVWLPGETTGSRLKSMRRRPGSVEMVGLTGALKFSSRREGGPDSSWKLGWMPVSATKRRRALSRKLMVTPRKRGNRVPRDDRGTKPREFSIRKGAGR